MPPRRLDLNPGALPSADAGPNESVLRFVASLARDPGAECVPPTQVVSAQLTLGPRPPRAPGSSRAVRNELMELRTAMRAGMGAPQAPKRKRFVTAAPTSPPPAARRARCPLQPRSPATAGDQVQRPSSPSNFRGDAVEEVATLVRRKPWTPWADAGTDRKRLGEAAPLKGSSQQALEDYLGVVRRLYYSPKGYPQAQTGDVVRAAGRGPSRASVARRSRIARSRRRCRVPAPCARSLTTRVPTLSVRP